MLALALLAAPAVGQVASFTMAEDAIEAPLDGLRGDPARGEAVVRNRETANCLICHSIPGAAESFMGEVGPPLAGVRSRLSPGQIRLRVVDPTLWNPQAIMPAYHRTEGLVRVDPRYRGRPVLTAQEVEDVVAYLSALEAPER
ncbi:sulfur oxidation c-type cytochrome SoxX [Roseomonas populi]|uniref:Sulfur oxidation c-type cytochrome SoxX n=1 Tax=Roseomonas populi TaxID=3121582 RepID=A0ABT1X3W6_9PROT|nr:sulfur oxidation c-type cytochrome SoxX [Roseomonas pecuniae]MCR0982767.1 sulfur oxidation c-type cytochrome SoxX [Roseomonas pecuniae]